MKNTKKFTLIACLFLGSFAIQCTHDDEEVIPVVGPDPIEHGTETLACTDCTPLESNGASSDFSSGNVPPDQWYFDKAHSNVMWQSPYKVFGSDLTGRFNYFVVDKYTFDEANPSQISFMGYVRLNSVNTGEPGRDGGCLLGTFGTDDVSTSETTNIAKITSVAGSGRYSTTDGGFIVDATFEFHGNSKEIPVKIYYHPQSDQETYIMSGFTAEFEFNPLSEFGIETTNIDDHVVVTMNLLFKNKKP